jgi:uncharacterized protein YecE (DUF72 family)
MFYIGTSGYDYPDWKGIFYPENLKRQDYLSFYAEQFNGLELNYSYYTQPTGAQLSQMVKKTEQKVHFAIKGNKDFTHSTTNWKESVTQFRRELYPLENNGLLLSVLLQFPQSFHYTPENRQYLHNLIAFFGNTPLCVEFRNREWIRNSVTEGLRERGCSLCLCDMPSLKNLPSMQEYPKITQKGASEKTTPLLPLYLRFHGRNTDNWYTGNQVSRYDYCYSEKELAEWVPFLLEDARENTNRAKNIFFNNHAQAAAAINARKLKLLLSKN